MGSWTVNVANFVTIKPWVCQQEGSKFSIWREQMVCLLESQDLLGFVDGTIMPPTDDTAEENEPNLWKRRDRLVKGWILGSIGDDALASVWDKNTAREVWLELEKTFRFRSHAHQPPSQTSFRPLSGRERGGGSRSNELHKAALRGDWKRAKEQFDYDEGYMTAPISHLADTALHVAVSTGKANCDFVKKLVALMPSQALALKNTSGDTALHCAAMVGNKEAAMILVDKNPDLVYIRNNYNRMPVNEATVFGHKETLLYLMSHTHMYTLRMQLDEDSAIRLLNSVITSEFFDVALDMVGKHPYLVSLIDPNEASALSTIAKMGSAFQSGENFSWWHNLIYHCLPVKRQFNRKSAQATPAADIENRSCNEQTYKSWFRIIRGVLGHKAESIVWSVMAYLAKEIWEKKTKHQEAMQLVGYLCQKMASLPQRKASTMFEESIVHAARSGISEIVEKIMEIYPTVVISAQDEAGRNVFLLAATYRFQNVINLLYKTSDRKFIILGCIDNEENNIMHICGNLAPIDRLNLVPGAALQMQRELQWFKISIVQEMENFVHPSRRYWKNRDDQTPQMLFTKAHRQLKEDGQKWMKETATACNIAATLIATVMFAAAFAVPGGAASNANANAINHVLRGSPTKIKNLFWEEFPLYVFAISDAMSLFTSITSLLMFLSILTSRYAEQDFLKLLPQRLILGLLSLFISIIFMLAAFCATMYLVFHQKLPWIIIPVAAFACLPVTSFVLLQFPLLVDVVYSTYGPGIFRKKRNRSLY